MEKARGDAGLTSEVELVRQMYGAIAAGDLDEFSKGLHPDVVWEHNPGGGSPEEGIGQLGASEEDAA
jgi:ketosteroid isomerase-like protein